MEIINYEKAISLGRNKFFTGNPCRKGHIAERYTRNCLCVVCLSESHKLWRSQNDRSKSKRQYYETNIKHILIKHAKRRALVRNIPFNLSVDDFDVPITCPVFGITLIVGRGVAHDASPTLDRIIPELGYIKNNVAVISKKANDLKGFANVEEHRRIADWMESVLKG